MITVTNEKPIRIVRTPHSKDRPYFSMARATAQDSNLSYEALGMLTYLLSKPDSWEINIKDIAKRSTKYKAYKILRELRKAGYMKLEKEKGEGRFGKWVYQIFETQQLIEFQQVENQQVENQHTQYVQSKPDSTQETQNTPRKRSERKREPFYDAISTTFKLSASGQIVCIRSMMLGNAKRGMWKECNFEPPVNDAQEILDFGGYMTKRIDDMRKQGKKIDNITAAVTIQRWFYDFREEKRKASQPMSEKERWASIPELRGITEIIR